MTVMTTHTDHTDIDISDRYDFDRERPIANFDWTLTVPSIPGTTDLHPMDCRCLPCRAEQEYLDWIEQDCDYFDEDRAFAEYLERRSETGTWFGRDDFDGEVW